jgi:hypothetical protein
MAERQWLRENAGGPASSSSRLVHIPVEPHVAGVGLSAPPGPRSPDLAGLATFTLDAQGRVATWTVAAARLFGCTARAIVGQDACEALMPGKGHAQLLRQALGEARAGRVWTATLSLALAGGGAVALRCEPMAEPGTGALMIAQRVPRQAGQVLLSEAATRIGTTLDLTQTAREAVYLTVPGFADGAAIVVPERMLAADEFVPHEPGRPLCTDGLVESRRQPLDVGTAAMRELLGRSLAEPGATLAGTCQLVSESLRRHGEDDITLVLARIRG